MYRYEYMAQELDRVTNDRNGIASWQAEKLEYAARERSMQVALVRVRTTCMLEVVQGRSNGYTDWL